MADVDWKKLRKEYISGGTSFRKLAKQYGISRGRIERRAKDEGWADAKDQRKAKAMAYAVESVAAAEASLAYGIYDAAGELLQALRECLAAMRAEGPIYPKSMKELTEALRNLQQVMDSKPTMLDVQEQEARIRKLQSEVQKAEDGGHKEITVDLGGASEYAV